MNNPLDQVRPIKNALDEQMRHIEFNAEMKDKVMRQIEQNPVSFWNREVEIPLSLPLCGVIIMLIIAAVLWQETGPAHNVVTDHTVIKIDNGYYDSAIFNNHVIPGGSSK